MTASAEVVVVEVFGVERCHLMTERFWEIQEHGQREDRKGSTPHPHHLYFL